MPNRKANFFPPFIQELSGDPVSLLVLSYFLLAAALQTGNGHYNPAAIILTLSSFALLVAAARRRLAPTASSDSSANPSGARQAILPVVLVACTVTGLIRLPLRDLRGPLPFEILYAVLSGAMGLLVVWAVLRRGGELSRTIFAYGVLAGFLLRVLVPVFSPSPAIDVFPIFQESARHLLQGLNPYLVPVSDVYHGTQSFGYKVLGYVYPPSNLYFQTLGYLIFHDIRSIYIFMEALACAGLYAMARRRQGIRFARYAVLLFLFHPRGLFIIEEAWTEPLVVGLYAICNYLAGRSPGSRRLAAAYGLLLSLKQYLLYFVLSGLLLERRVRRLALAAAVAFATVLPFLLWDRASFIQYGLLFLLRTKFRPDGLTVLAALHALTGFEAGKLISLAMGFAVGLYTTFRFRSLGLEGWRWVNVLTTFSIFLVGSQAFANHYYFVGAMILFAAAGHGEAMAGPRAFGDPAAEPRGLSSASP